MSKQSGKGTSCVIMQIGLFFVCGCILAIRGATGVVAIYPQKVEMLVVLAFSVTAAHLHCNALLLWLHAIMSPHCACANADTVASSMHEMHTCRLLHNGLYSDRPDSHMLLHVIQYSVQSS